MNASSSTPVCIYCLERCFVPLPGDIKEKHRKKYIDRDVNLIATCQEGKKFEKERLGICYDDLQVNCDPIRGQILKSSPA